jgi:hypothetical protein
MSKSISFAKQFDLLFFTKLSVPVILQGGWECDGCCRVCATKLYGDEQAVGANAASGEISVFQYVVVKFGWECRHVQAFLRLCVLMGDRSLFL